MKNIYRTGANLRARSNEKMGKNSRNSNQKAEKSRKNFVNSNILRVGTYFNDVIVLILCDFLLEYSKLIYYHIRRHTHSTYISFTRKLQQVSFYSRISLFDDMQPPRHKAILFIFKDVRAYLLVVFRPDVAGVDFKRINRIATLALWNVEYRREGSVS